MASGWCGQPVPDGPAYQDAVRAAIANCLRPLGQSGDGCVAVVRQNEAGQLLDSYSRSLQPNGAARPAFDLRRCLAGEPVAATERSAPLQLRISV